ncbi:MAG: GNAT family N-acetyltransferase [Anaerolineales bacterium]|nr:GNAT family N-acetyltransferase [Anaerolineales bacterium]
MPEIHIRTLIPTDAEAYLALRRRALTEFPTAFGRSVDEIISVETFIERLENPDSWAFGAFDGTTLIGIVGLVRYRYKKMHHKAMIVGMFVATERQSSGVGRLLMEAAISQARQLAGVEQLALTVASDNPPAIRLYTSLGFERWGVEPRAMKYQGKYYNEDYMWLKLA